MVYVCRSKVRADEILGLGEDRRLRLSREEVPNGHAASGEYVMADRDPRMQGAGLLVELEARHAVIRGYRHLTGQVARPRHRCVERVDAGAIGVEPEMDGSGLDLGPAVAPTGGQRLDTGDKGCGRHGLRDEMKDVLTTAAVAGHLRVAAGMTRGDEQENGRDG